MAVREEFHTTQFTTRVHILHFVRAIVVKDASSIRIYLDTISSTETSVRKLRDMIDESGRTSIIAQHWTP